MSPTDSIFPFLLFVVSLATFDMKHMNSDIRTITLLTQSTMIINLFFQYQWVQQLAHDVFVYTLLIGLLVESCVCTFILSNFVGVAMLVTRMYYGRCIILLWNENRNKDVDVVMFILIITSLLRKRPLLNKRICMLIAVASHFVEDIPRESIMFSS